MKNTTRPHLHSNNVELIQGYPDGSNKLADPGKYRICDRPEGHTGSHMTYDCVWPVEARFLAACVDASPDERRFSGPYPLVEISSVMMAVGKDPMKNHARRQSEMPVHNPVADARKSARLLLDAVEVTKLGQSRIWPSN